MLILSDLVATGLVDLEGLFIYLLPVTRNMLSHQLVRPVYS